MNIIEELKKFNKRWEISDNSTYQEEFEKFRTRILNSFRNIDSELSINEIENFCNVLGIKFHTQNHGDVILTLKNTIDEKLFYKILQVLCLLPIASKRNRHTRHITDTKTDIIKRVITAIELSKVNLTYVMDGEILLLYPAGEKELDNKLVNEVLKFLNPESNGHFTDALKLYENQNFIKSAESTRRSLEEFLRFKLNNSKGLEANISELQNKLKTTGRDPLIRNIIFQTFNYLDKYFNENSKHNDGEINEIENEYLIYQTGLLLRYINRSL